MQETYPPSEASVLVTRWSPVQRNKAPDSLIEFLRTLQL